MCAISEWKCAVYSPGCHRNHYICNSCDGGISAIFVTSQHLTNTHTTGELLFVLRTLKVRRSQRSKQACFNVSVCQKHIIFTWEPSIISPGQQESQAGWWFVTSWFMWRHQYIICLLPLHGYKVTHRLPEVQMFSRLPGRRCLWLFVVFLYSSTTVVIYRSISGCFR